MNPETAEQIIMSRLLILQSKRLLLNSTERLAEETGMQSLQARVDRLRREANQAQHDYRAAMLRLGSPQQRDYWLIAYGRLIEMGQVLTGKLRTAALDLSPAERYEVSADVEMLEAVVDGWIASLKRSMAAAVA
jgi:hypothetical protein